MNLWLVAALVYVASVVVTGATFHHRGYQEAERDAQARAASATAAAVEAANATAREDLRAAIDAERKRTVARSAAADRRAGLEQSIRTEVVYRDSDCVLPAADGLRINAALRAARAAAEDAARGRDGPVRSPERPDGPDLGWRDEQAAGNSRGAVGLRPPAEGTHRFPALTLTP